jgi:hypothetical protein
MLLEIFLFVVGSFVCMLFFMPGLGPMKLVTLMVVAGLVCGAMQDLAAFISTRRDKGH